MPSKKTKPLKTANKETQEPVVPPTRVNDDELQKLRAYREKVIESRASNQDARDKAVLSLSGGALAVSFAFVDHFVTDTPRVSYLLFFSWFCWALSLVTLLLSYQASERAHDLLITKTDSRLRQLLRRRGTGEKIDEVAAKGEPQAQERKEHESKLSNYFDKAVTYLNNGFVALFILGTVSLGAFVYENYGFHARNCGCQQSTCETSVDCHPNLRR